MLLGLARPDSGSVSVFGADPVKAMSAARCGAMLQVGRVPETLKVSEHIDLFSSYYPNPLPLAETLKIAGPGRDQASLVRRTVGRAKQRRAVRHCHLRGSRSAVPRRAHSRARRGGAPPDVGADSESSFSVGKTVLLTTHYLNEADALADRVLVLIAGPVDRRRYAVGDQGPRHG